MTLMSEVLAYLRAREWKRAAHIGGNPYWCDECSNLRVDGHANYCLIAALIAKIEENVGQS